MTEETTPVVVLPPVKPGYKTTEFWLKLAAMALTALYASGAMTNNTAIAIAGIAATMLGALGYSVSRGLVKAAGVLLVGALFASTQIGCATVKKDVPIAVHAVVDCAKLDASQLLELTVEVVGDAAEAIARTGQPDWTALESHAEQAGTDLAQCAFIEYWAATHPPDRVPALTSALAAPAADLAALAKLRSTYGVSYRVGSRTL